MYNSNHIDPQDVAAYKRIIDQIRFDTLTPTQKLACAQALEQKATELRQDSAEVNRAAKNDVW
uniref:hypothetical protein n=1 Tax=Trichocoleus desertorum TaxID=1481672 RepID=UPI0025B5BB0C|nr:hypothetical protein [Trichocoleus desertorum]